MTPPLPRTSRIAVKTAPESTEVLEFPLPPIGETEGLLRIEACGVGGAEPEHYRSPRRVPIAMGHQIVGTIVALGARAGRMWNVELGERVALQEYFPCKSCAWCLQGEYRFCPEADMFGGAKPRRIGLLDHTEAPHLVGGFAEYMHLPWNTVIHKIPQDLPAALGTLAIGIGNGVQWATMDMPVTGPGKTILVIGPGQQGLGCVLAAKEAGASKIILAGMSRDQRRLDLAPELGADHVINVETHDLAAEVRRVTNGGGLDVVVDTTGDPGAGNLKQYIELANKGAWLWVNCTDSAVPVQTIKEKYITIRSGRGRTWRATEEALRIITSGKYPLERMCTHTFGLDEVDTAIRATGGKQVDGAIHVVVEPWK